MTDRLWTEDEYRHLSTLESLTSDGDAARLLTGSNRGDLLVVTNTDTGKLADIRVASSAGVWREDNDKVHHWMMEELEELYARRASVGGEDTPKLFNHLRFQSRASSRRSSLESVGPVYLQLRKELDALPELPELEVEACSRFELDSRHRYLGAPNGVIDLEGEHPEYPWMPALLTGREAREALVTQMVGTEYVPEAYAWPEADALTGHVDEQSSAWIWSAVGFAIRGAPDRRIYLLVGPPGGGKSTLLEAFRLALGEYGGSVAVDTLRRDAPPSSAGLNPEHAPMVECRFVALHELDGVRLGTALLKRWAGGEPIAVRKPYQQPEAPRPVTATLFISMNDGETERALDVANRGLFERVRVLRYPALPSMDSSFRQRLHEERFKQSVLARLMMFARSNASPPDDVPGVAAERERLRRDSVGPELAAWIDAHVEVTGDERDRLTSRELWDTVVLDAKESGDWDEKQQRVWGYPRRSFTRRVGQLVDGLPQQKVIHVGGKAQQGWVGVRLMFG